MTKPKPTQVKVEVCRGQAGDALYIADYRVAGPRHNGVMTTIKTWMVDRDDLKEALGRK